MKEKVDRRRYEEREMRDRDEKRRTKKWCCREMFQIGESGRRISSENVLGRISFSTIHNLTSVFNYFTCFEFDFRPAGINSEWISCGTASLQDRKTTYPLPRAVSILCTCLKTLVKLWTSEKEIRPKTFSEHIRLPDSLIWNISRQRHFFVLLFSSRSLNSVSLNIFFFVYFLFHLLFFQYSLPSSFVLSSSLQFSRLLFSFVSSCLVSLRLRLMECCVVYASAYGVCGVVYSVCVWCLCGVVRHAEKPVCRFKTPPCVLSSPRRYRQHAHMVVENVRVLPKYTVTWKHARRPFIGPTSLRAIISVKIFIFGLGFLNLPFCLVPFWVTVSKSASIMSA